MIYATSPRLTLRQLRLSDLPQMATLLNDWDVAKWMVMVPFPYTQHDADTFFNLITPLYRDKTPDYYVIADKSTDTYIGSLGAHLMEGHPSWREIGYWLGKDYWDQGIMTEALTALIPFVFENSTIKKLVAYTNPANEPSQNILKKTNFIYDGIHPRTKPERKRGSTEVTVWHLDAPRPLYTTHCPED